MAKKHSLIGKVLDGDYRITSFLGKGGMGSVYAAQQISLNREVAIKLLPAYNLQPHELQRFEYEIATMATLCHTNIVTIHHRGKYGDPINLFYVMELLRGGSLKNYLHKYGKIPPSKAIRLIRPLAEALMYAHDHGCIHRDIKPDNLLFDDFYNSLKIADFGIAKLESSMGITDPQALVGTYLYAAPEQMQWYEDNQMPENFMLDERADQYSLGAVLYEMITGKPPYYAKSIMGMMKALNRPHPPVSQAAGYQVPAGLCWLISTMIQKSRENRFQKDQALLDALVNIEADLVSSVSTRVFTVKSPDPFQITSPTSQMSYNEKVMLQSMETMECSPNIRVWENYRNKILVALFGLLMGVFLVYLAIPGKKKNPTKETPQNQQNQQNHKLPREILLINQKIQYLLLELQNQSKKDEMHIVEFLKAKHVNLTPTKVRDFKVAFSSASQKEIVEQVALQVEKREIFLNAPKKEPTQENPEKVKVTLTISPSYYPKPPKNYPKLRIFLFSNKAVYPVNLDDKIDPGTYRISVSLPGYTCEQQDQRIKIFGQLYYLQLNLIANRRKVLNKVIDLDNGQSVTPKIFQIDGLSVQDRVFRPGKHYFYIIFEDYQKIAKEVYIPPEGESKTPFQYKDSLAVLMGAHFTLESLSQKRVEVEVDGKKLLTFHLKTEKIGNQRKVYMKFPRNSRYITFFTGFYRKRISGYRLRSASSIHLDEIDVDLLLLHLGKFLNEKDFAKNLNDILKKVEGRIVNLRSVRKKLDRYVQQKWNKSLIEILEDY